MIPAARLMSSLRHLIVAGLCAVGAAACANILGDGFKVEEDDDGSSSGTTTGATPCQQGDCASCTDCPACAICETDHACSVERDNCNNTPDCLGYTNCLNDPASCASTCEDCFPAGVTPFFDLIACNCDACGDTCAMATVCQG